VLFAVILAPAVEIKLKELPQECIDDTASQWMNTINSYHAKTGHVQYARPRHYGEGCV